jgi:hypothetical protein
MATDAHGQLGESGSGTTRRYLYRALESSKHIRLLHLMPAVQPDLPLEFSVQQKNLPDAIASYEAVSYVWGVPDFSCRLRCIDDNSELHITKNADALLRRFRDEYHTRILWIDAVCINQKDDEEKSTQIPLMGQIYRFASNVLAWLGEGGIEDGVIPLIHRSSRNIPIDNEVLTTSSLASSGSGLLQLNGPDGARTQAALENFFDLPWFRRRWIIQEIVFNAENYLHYGQHQISWFRFMSTVASITARASTKNMLQKLGPTTKVFDLWRSWSFIPERNNLWGTPGSREEDSLLFYLVAFDEYRCSDPKDMIYALSAMAGIPHLSSPPAEEIFEVDYSQSPEQCYMSFAASVTYRGHVSQILHQASGRNYRPGDLDIPSWVPNWMIPYRETDIFPHNLLTVIRFRELNDRKLTIAITLSPLYLTTANPSTCDSFATVTSSKLLPNGLDRSTKDGILKEYLSKNLGMTYEQTTKFLVFRDHLPPDDHPDDLKVWEFFATESYLISSGSRPKGVIGRMTVYTMDVNGNEYSAKETIEEFERNVYEEINGPGDRTERTIFLTDELGNGTNQSNHTEHNSKASVRVGYLGWGSCKIEPGDKVIVFFSYTIIPSISSQRALIIRPVGNVLSEHDKPTQYRLVGLAHVRRIAVSTELITGVSFAESIWQLFRDGKLRWERDEKGRLNPLRVEVQLV